MFWALGVLLFLVIHPLGGKRIGFTALTFCHLPRIAHGQKVEKQYWAVTATYSKGLQNTDRSSRVGLDHPAKSTVGANVIRSIGAICGLRLK